MTKLSKTAQAAMNAVERGNQTKKVELTDAEKIRQIRLNVEAGLSIPPDFIRLLLREYDALAAQTATTNASKKSETPNSLTHSYSDLGGYESYDAPAAGESAPAVV